MRKLTTKPISKRKIKGGKYEELLYHEEVLDRVDIFPDLPAFLGYDSDTKTEIKRERQISNHAWFSEGKQHYSLTYVSWKGMMNRVYLPSSDKYFHYHIEKGIRVCIRWHSFLNFLKDMGIRPCKELTIERKNNEDHYYPNNCKWDTKENQEFNKVYKNKSSEYRGMYWDSCKKRWRARISIDNKDKHLGYFKCEIKAAKAYDKASYEKHKRLDFLNFPEEVLKNL